MSLTDKYRPTKLSDVLGQAHVVKSLERVIHDKRAKAFIFAGPSGCGKTTLARILANQFAAGRGNITNITERDAAFASGAEAVRELVSGLGFRAIGESPTKTIILDECHTLSNTAWKILLKPIEEPPEHVYWMLCTTEPGKIPQTIKTRCITYTLQAVKEEEILGLLCDICDAEHFEVSDEVLEAVSEGAAGSPRQALNLLEACLYCKTAAEARIQMRTAGQTKETIDLCRFIASDRGSWADAMKLVKALDGSEPESIRIVVLNYLSAVAMNSGQNKVLEILRKMEAFSTPFNQSDKQAPLLLAIGDAMRIGS